MTPPALMAATPVGATTMGRFLEPAITSFRNVVLPVPALPVKKMLRPVFSTKSHAVRSIPDVSSVARSLSLFCSINQYLSVCGYKITKNL